MFNHTRTYAFMYVFGTAKPNFLVSFYIAFDRASM